MNKIKVTRALARFTTTLLDSTGNLDAVTLDRLTALARELAWKGEHSEIKTHAKRLQTICETAPEADAHEVANRINAAALELIAEVLTVRL